MYAHKEKQREKNTPNLYGVECREICIYSFQILGIKMVTFIADGKG